MRWKRLLVKPKVSLRFRVGAGLQNQSRAQLQLQPVPCSMQQAASELQKKKQSEATATQKVRMYNVVGLMPRRGRLHPKMGRIIIVPPACQIRAAAARISSGATVALAPFPSFCAPKSLHCDADGPRKRRFGRRRSVNFSFEDTLIHLSAADAKSYF